MSLLSCVDSACVSVEDGFCVEQHHGDDNPEEPGSSVQATGKV